jgi:DNA-binding NarL/FixJ family response regulator
MAHVNAPEGIKVMVVDDHPVVRVGITTIIDTQPDMTVVAETGNGEEAVALFRKHRPDLTVMDLRLESTGGAECIRSIRREFPDARFVVLTTYRGDEDIHQALEAGASGYLIKGMPRKVLLDALRRVHQGERFLPPPVSQVLAARKPEVKQGNCGSIEHRRDHSEVPPHRNLRAARRHRSHSGRYLSRAARPGSPLSISPGA